MFKTSNRRVLDKVKITDKGKGVLINFTDTTSHELDPGVDPETAPLPPKATTIKTSMEGNAPPHEDLTRAMRKLRKLALQICGIDDLDNLDDYTATGLSLSGTGDETMAVITINKKVDWSGKVYTFNTPATQLADNERYADSDKLDKICHEIENEALAYVAGKHGVPDQLELEFSKTGDN